MEKVKCQLCGKRRAHFSLWSFTDKTGTRQVCRFCLELLCEIVSLCLNYRRDKHGKKVNVI
jgi:hypothetical protein